MNSCIASNLCSNVVLSNSFCFYVLPSSVLCGIYNTSFPLVWRSLSMSLSWYLHFWLHYTVSINCVIDCSLYFRVCLWGFSVSLNNTVVIQVSTFKCTDLLINNNIWLLFWLVAAILCFVQLFKFLDLESPDIIGWEGDTQGVVIQLSMCHSAPCGSV